MAVWGGGQKATDNDAPSQMAVFIPPPRPVGMSWLARVHQR